MTLLPKEQKHGLRTTQGGDSLTDARRRALFVLAAEREAAILSGWGCRNA